AGRLRVIRLEREQMLEARCRLVEIALLHQRNSEAMARLRRGRCQRYRALVVRLRLSSPALPHAHLAEPEEGGGVIVLVREGVREMRRSSLEAVEQQQRARKVEMAISIAGISCERLAHEFSAGLVAAGIASEDAEHVERIG